MKAKTRKFTLLGSIALASVLALSLGVSGVFAAAASGDDEAGRYYSDFTSKEAAFAASEDTNVALAEEGIVLLKNDGTLPLEKGSKVSVLGIAQDAINETTGSVSESLKEAGFRVNPTLEEKYLNDSATNSDYGSETALTAAEKSSLGLYSDAAVIVIGRGDPGESSDRSIKIDEVEDETYLGSDQGWTHEAHETDSTGSTSYKHELQLTKSEEELIKLAEKKCDKVVVLYSSANIFEMGNLNDDPEINAIAWIGRLGTGGIKAVGEILSGDVNPSGKTVEVWMRDFTNDPTYANALVQNYLGEDGEPVNIMNSGMAQAMPNDPDYVTYDQAGAIDYEEDIYIGYKFYETYYHDAKQDGTSLKPSIPGLNKETATIDEWYDYNVVYPFGYGLSYTDFSYEIEGVSTNLGSVSENTTLDVSSFSTSAGDVKLNSSSTKIVTMSADIKVTNTGDTAGKETVQLYAEAPYYTGETEKSYINLVGYAKTGTLKPGQSETVTVTFNVQDMASYDYIDSNGDGHIGYELDQGTYTLHFMESSSHHTMDTDAYSSFSFNIGMETSANSSRATNKAATLDVDDYSGNEITNLFSDPENDYYSMAVSADAGSMISPIEANADGTGNTESTMLTRADFDGSMPTNPWSTNDGQDMVLPSTSQATFMFYDNWDADTYSDEGMPWEKTVDDLPSDWTQGAGVVGKDGTYEIVLDDMRGVALDDPMWTTFMNQMTWDEIATLLNDGYHETPAIETIGKAATVDNNGPNYSYNASSGVAWVCEPNIAASWNTDLAYEEGRMIGNTMMWQGLTGWYGPGMNFHRTPFGGRNPEYYAQDGTLCGYTGTAVIQGAESIGITAYTKHFGISDVCAIFSAKSANLSEQNMRENYMRPFQMSMQEGNVSAAMSAGDRIGYVYCGHNYALLTELAREEWGWTGYIITDFVAGIPNASVDGFIRAGGDIPDGNPNHLGSDVLSGTWNADYVWTDENSDPIANAPKGAVMVGEGENEYASATQWYCARMSAQRLLYGKVNSAGNRNGVTMTERNVNITATQGTEIKGENLLTDDFYAVGAEHPISNCVVTSGSLPDGISVSGGVLSGTVSGTEDCAFTVTVYVDGWIPIEVNVSISVTPMVSVRDDISNLEAGQSVSTYAMPVTELGASGYTVYVSEGSLPQGLTVASNGLISGTPIAAGTYSFTLAMDVTVSGTTSTYYLPYTITVTGSYAAGSEGRGIESMEINANGELVVTYTDGETDNLGKVVGADGEDGSGCGSAVELAGTAIALLLVLAAAAVVYATVRRSRRNS